MPSNKVVVFASSFLDELQTMPETAGIGKRLLQKVCDNPSIGATVEFRCDRDPRSSLTANELSGVRAVIADLEHYEKELLSQVGPAAGGELELIARYGVGVDSVDVSAATGAGILVSNTPGANSLPTAEWAVSTLLDVAGRRIPHHERAAKSLPKSGPSRLDVSERTLGVVGTGAIGRTVVDLLAGFNMRVLAYDPFPHEEWARGRGVTYVGFDQLCRESDFITLHAATDRQIVGPDKLSNIRPTTVLINCARGILVDHRAAYNAVRSGALWGYGLDEIWPHRDLPLEGLNIATSPHVGSDTDAGKAKMQELSAQSVVDFLSGTLPESPLNPEARPDLE